MKTRYKSTYPHYLFNILSKFFNLARYYPYTLLVSVCYYCHLIIESTKILIGVSKDFHRFREILHRDFSPMHSSFSKSDVSANSTIQPFVPLTRFKLAFPKKQHPKCCVYISSTTEAKKTL